MRHLALVSVPTAFLATIFLAAHSSAAPLADRLADGLLYVVYTMTNSVTTTVMLNDPAYGVAVNRAGSRVYFAGSRGGAPNGVLQVLDTATNTVSGTVTVGNGATGVTVNPAGTRVYVTAQSENRLYVVDATSNAVIATVPVDSD